MAAANGKAQLLAALDLLQSWAPRRMSFLLERLLERMRGRSGGSGATPGVGSRREGIFGLVLVLSAWGEAKTRGFGAEKWS